MQTPRPSPFTFCPSCGQKGIEFLRQHEFRCPACGFRYFHSVATAVGALLMHEGKALFIERALEPSKGKLGLPGGFTDPGESAEQSLAREVREEVGGQVGTPVLLASFPNQYTFGKAWYHTCDFYFQAELVTPPDELVIDPAEVTRLVWLNPRDVDLADLAFPSLQAFWRFLLSSGRLG
ncbi:MAG: NUDIX domain-containing protein [Spirochaetales bacterium]